MRKVLLTLIIILSFVTNSKASHVLGGEITWECQNGKYVFQLIYYRDCNGADVNTVAVNLDVWNHPSISSISLAFVSRADISPYCMPVSNSPSALTCGSGTSGGNGAGSIEKIIYRSTPITLPGVPPANGWIFTFQDFSRSGSITNLASPTSYGITVTAKMFEKPAIDNSNGCVDSSPRFLQEPYFVSCIGTTYNYSSNIIDPDNDSISVQFGVPYNNFPAGTTYNPPANPIPVPFNPGFTYLSPTPNQTFNTSNIPAVLNSQTGQLSFTSYYQGNFNVKLIAKSYRNGILIAEVEREMQLIVMACDNANNPPNIAPPFPGFSFTKTVVAGQPVNFTISSQDIEFLQDGSPQHNLLTTSGLMYGTNFTSTTGCDIAPCATLDATPVIQGTQGVSTTFNWQTSCDHLVNDYGIVGSIVPYHFVFKIQDDYCQVPKVSYATVTINIVNPNVIEAPQIDCIQSNAAGDMTINWTPVQNIANSFSKYQVCSVQDGVIATLTNINDNTYTIPGTTVSKDFYLTVFSGCNGTTPRYSDTIKSIFMTLSNPTNGTAVLHWNDPDFPKQFGMNEYYYIYREFPAGVWVLRDSVAYGVNDFIDTTDVCADLLKYQIRLKNTICNYTSNITQGYFQDIINPDIPVITSVSIDTITNAMTIVWNQNPQPDTYGYIIYQIDKQGAVTAIDTVWGWSTIMYGYNPDLLAGPYTYSVAAFDSCRLSNDPDNYQTSAKANPHTSIQLDLDLDYCNNQISLAWSSYLGWEEFDSYEIFVRKNGGVWDSLTTTQDTTYEFFGEAFSTYCFVVRGYDEEGRQAFSNSMCELIQAPKPSQFNYLRVGTVEDKQIKLESYIDIQSNVKEIALEKFNASAYVEIQRQATTAQVMTFVDEEVLVDRQDYFYRTVLYDSCGNQSITSNISHPMLLTMEIDSLKGVFYLSWTPYSKFEGSLLGYNIYRGQNGIFESTPLVTVSSGQNHYIDNVANNETFYQFGQFCYKITALESMNIYGFYQRSTSNEVCSILDPIVYVPNSFTPDADEVNQEFIPIFTYFDIHDYRFTIYDRWEHVVFESTDYLEGWNGQILNTGYKAIPGTYVYHLSLHDGNGREVVRRGYVNLIR